MTTWFISRHPGALQWMREEGHHFDRHVPHLDIEQVQAGDTVVGTLPITLIAQVCTRNAQYWHLSFPVPPTARGSELSAAELNALGAKLERFEARVIPSGKTKP